MQNSFQISSQILFDLHLKNDSGKYCKLSIKKSPTLRFRGPILEPFAWLFPGGERFFCLPISFSESPRAPPKVIFWPPWALFDPPFWNDVGIQRRFWVHTPYKGTCLSSESVGQIRKCHSNTSQTHDAIKAFNKSKSCWVSWWWATPFLAIMFWD